jgi:lysophospholipase L1-like esterase
MDPGYAPLNTLGTENNVTLGFAALHQLQKEHGFNLSVIAWPYFTDKAIEPAANLLPGTLRDKFPPIEQLSKQYGFRYLSLEETFKLDFANRVANAKKLTRRPSPRWNYTIGDGTHPSKSGAKVAAKSIAEMLRKD